jgi:hypothetical protein
MSRSLCVPEKFTANNFGVLVARSAVKTLAPSIETADGQRQEHTDQHKDIRNGGDPGVHFISDIFKHFFGQGGHAVPADEGRNNDFVKTQYEREKGGGDYTGPDDG